VRGSGLDWVLLRPGGFASNALACAESVRRTRTLAAVLVDARHDGRVYELTGPELSTPRQRTAAIAAALGEPVTFVEQTAAQARRQVVTFMPEPVARNAELFGQDTQRQNG
jgi:uncharacterized protein YbjT (DUF2867 family)